MTNWTLDENLTSAEAVARRVYDTLCNYAHELGFSTKNIFLRTPDDIDLVMDEYCEGEWHVAWEEGPRGWALEFAMAFNTTYGSKKFFVDPARSWVVSISEVNL